MIPSKLLRTHMLPYCCLPERVPCIHHFSANEDSCCLSNADIPNDDLANPLADAHGSSNTFPCIVSIDQACANRSRHKLDSVSSVSETKLEQSFGNRQHFLPHILTV
jgi:hypothetical protein